MPYERLLKSNRIKPHRANQNEIKQLLQLALRDLSTATRNLEEAPDWAYSIAYNSILQAARALMYFDGYRPRGGEQHATWSNLLKNDWELLIHPRCGYSIRCGGSD